MTNSIRNGSADNIHDDDLSLAWSDLELIASLPYFAVVSPLMVVKQSKALELGEFRLVIECMHVLIVYDVKVEETGAEVLWLVSENIYAIS